MHLPDVCLRVAALAAAWLFIPGSSVRAETGDLASAASAEIQRRAAHGAEPVALPDRALESRELEIFLDGMMAAQFSAHKLAGAAVVVVKDGAVLLSKGYGYADLERRTSVDPLQTRFTVGSISKVIIWTAVMQLVEQGRLDLDADVNRYLLRFKLPDTFAAPVTMRHLLTHTAGFEEVGAPFAAQDASKYSSLGEFLADHMPARVLPPPRDLAHATRPYSNWGALLAAHVVECISNRSFAQYAAENILVPLGMRNSVFADARSETLAHRAQGYVYRQGEMSGALEDMAPSGPAGGMIATADDIGKLMLAHLQGGRLGDARILEERTIRLMQQRGAQASDALDGMALGFMDGRRNGRRILRHDGSTQYTHSELMLVPDAGLGLFVVYNSQDGGYARREFVRAFVDRYLPATRPAVAAKDDDLQPLAQYAGAYRSERRSFTTFEKLLGSLPLRVTPMTSGALLLGGEQWTPIAQDIFQNPLGERVVFQRTRGRINGFSLKSSLVPVRRIEWFQDPRWHAVGVLLILISAGAAVQGAFGKKNIGSSAQKRVKTFLGLLGVLIIVTTLLLGSVFAAGLATIMTQGVPARLFVGVATGLAAAGLTLVLSLVIVVMAKKQRSMNGLVLPSVHCACALLFVVLLHYWNLLGWRVG
jgi:CubicO group peptidase (beta-lactamase class C family)